MCHTIHLCSVQQNVFFFFPARSRVTDIENKLVVTSGDREVGRVDDIEMAKGGVITGFYEIICVKLEYWKTQDLKNISFN